MDLDHPTRITRFEQAENDGKSWAQSEFQQAGDRNVALDLEDMIKEVAIAYATLKTGKLPSLFTDCNMNAFEQQIDLIDGFTHGADCVVRSHRQTSH